MKSYGKVILVSLIASLFIVGGCAKQQASSVRPGVPGLAAADDAAKGMEDKGGKVVAEDISSRTMKEIPPESKAEQVVFKDIRFDFDKADIRPEDMPTLEAIANWLLSNRQKGLIIEGHCDERGSNEYNLALGDRRAKSAEGYLLAQGVSADRITTISYGEERPVDPGHSEGSWSQNRRAHFLVR